MQKTKISLKGKEKQQKQKKPKKEAYRNLFGLDDEMKEHSSEEDENPEINIIVYYDGKKISTKFNKHRVISDFIQFLQKKYFKVNLEENYKIFYEQTEIPANDKRKIKKLMKSSENDDEEIKFILKAKGKTFLNAQVKKVYIELENIPSFMDLSDQINKFIDSQDTEINFDIIYRDNCCRILFSSSEIAFSFISYMTNIKFTNKYYRKLRIDIKYNTKGDIMTNSISIKNNDNSKQSNSEIAENNEMNNNNINNNLSNIALSQGNLSKSQKKLKLNSFHTLNNEDYYINNNLLSIRDSTPYGEENLLSKLEQANNRKKWMNNKGFFTSINKNSFNRLISPNHRLFHNKVNNSKNIQQHFFSPNPRSKVYKLKISDV